MTSPTPAAPEPVPVPRPLDPLAVALANASLLGVGYLMLGRRRLAAGTGLVSVVLAVLLGWVVRSVWLEIVVLLYWAALVAHGWLLAGGPVLRGAVRRQRHIAVAVAVPVLLAVGLLRFDAHRIEQTVTEARHSGDCAQALSALDRVWFAHRVADAPLTVRGELTAQACQRLRAARETLSTALGGDTDALKEGFDALTAVLAELPGHEEMVEVILDGFLDELPADDPCDTVTVTNWLGQRESSNNTLDRSADVVARLAPAALLGCGEDFMATEDWETARARFQQLLTQYPGHELRAKATEGVRKATRAIELANVRGLLEGSTGGQPEYCSTPARYSGAAPYGKGTNRALFYGNDTYLSRLPAQWRATDATDAVLVVCAGVEEFGAAVETCPYENKLLPRFPREVTFHRIAIPVKAYELRTGKLVVDTKVEINGESCPDVLSYDSPVSVDIGPPSDVHVIASDADVRASFASLITP